MSSDTSTPPFDLGNLRAEGAAIINVIYLVPAAEYHSGRPYVFVWRGGAREAYYRRWLTLGRVTTAVEPHALARVLRDHTAEILALSAAYRGPRAPSTDGCFGAPAAQAAMTALRDKINASVDACCWRAERDRDPQHALARTKSRCARIIRGRS